MSVNAVSFSTGSTTGASASSSVLSDDTKKKLQALGLDPSKYTSEAQAQQAIQDAQTKQESTRQSGNKGSFETIKTEVQELAGSMGISAGSNDKISDIMSSISDKISELQSSAGSDQTKLSQVNSYNSQYTSITNEIAQMEAAKSMTGATALANYNKIALGIK